MKRKRNRQTYSGLDGFIRKWNLVIVLGAVVYGIADAVMGYYTGFSTIEFLIGWIEDFQLPNFCISVGRDCIGVITF